jgi:type I restriction enzyme R subunit
VVRIDLDRDLLGWRPNKGQRDKYGNEIEDRIYNPKDFDRSLVLEKRTELVAQKVTEFLKQTNRFDKAIVFCENIDHAERMRQALANANSDLVAENSKYVMRITGDNPEGKAELDNFIFPESVYPVIATTSKLMTTGVDAKTCKLIVLDRRIQSMTEFKQIIGRGTRIDEDYDKFFFTIIDFKKATELFADPDFDGDPVQIYEPKSGDPPVPPDEFKYSETDRKSKRVKEPTYWGDWSTDDDDHPKRYIVADVEVKVVGERVQYYDANGKLITESLEDYTRKAVNKEFASLNDFLRRWSETDKKQAIIKELASEGVFFEELAQEVGRDCDPFDLICHIVWDVPPLNRRERAREVRQRNYFTKYGDLAQRVLDALLEKYADEGIEAIEEPQILKIAPFTEMGTPIELVQDFGGIQGYQDAIGELERELYRA